MNHGSYDVFNKYAPLVLSHKVISGELPLGLGSYMC